ncbi:DNA polymerase III subunit epsilon [Taibaiella sp. KBW10]|uniref:3'-5' exonuclease n=1 Tax=Taibaiella sp. KBW10 TaxID=2153357 RepID=UPI000F59703F|nr:3'-5' exonuclease [Taibaiella sp. KBW10]RQO31203.1 DNA polymerase III subunit epsilon [Taibaiella sp. KBW10]
MAQLQLEKPIAFFDLETTGVDPAKDRIIEIAIVKLNTDGTRDTYIKRINPERAIPAETTAIHGITDDDVKDAPTFKQVAHDIFTFIKNCDLGGYNSNKFDIPCLAEELLRAGVEVDFKKRKLVDVQQVFYKMEPRTLSAAYNFYCQKEHVNAHAALADVEATIEILESQLDRYNGTIENNVVELHKFTGGDDFVDYARRIVLKNGVAVFNFGKHKGVPVEQVFKKEPQYYDWMMQSDFALNTKQCISEILNAMLLKK